MTTAARVADEPRFDAGQAIPGCPWTAGALGPAHDLAHADELCRRVLAGHAENFLVASPLVPAPVRAHLTRIYAFCRITDDLGDELGDAAPAALRAWRDELEGVLLHGALPRTAVTLALRETVRARALPADPFLELIGANEQDQEVRAYDTWEELLGYCRLSAAPVGRMVLGVVGIHDPAAVQLSDDVCIGLQLANFAQDVSVDRGKGRRYLVGDDLEAAGVEGAVARMCDRADQLLGSGRRLEAMTHGWLRAQLALYRHGGQAVVAAIRARGHATADARPALSAADRLRTGLRVLPSLAAGPPVVDAELAAAARHCQRLARRDAANFYWGFVALPQEQRDAIYAVYDFARQVDDVADRPDAFDTRLRLEGERRRLRAALAGDGGDDPVLRVLGVAMRRHAIPVEDIEAIIAGVERDAGRVRYATWDDLAEYCGLVASAVGRICVRVFGYADPQALDRADDLGLALQLTNILRDVREDAGMGRIYLPRTDLAAFGIDEEQLLAALGAGDAAAAPLDPAAWAALVHFEAARAERLFRAGLRVCDFVPYRAATCVRTMAGIYHTLLRRIEAEPTAVLERRLRLSGRRKLAVLARSCL